MQFTWPQIHTATRQYGVIGILIASAVLLIFSRISGNLEYNAFRMLAESISHGRLDLQSPILQQGYPVIDFIYYQDKVYIPFGPFPAAIYLLFLAVPAWAATHIITYLLIGLCLFAWYKLARRMDFTVQNGFWVAFAFIFASPMLFVNVYPSPNGMSSIIVVLLLVMVLYEYLGKRRYGRIGLLYACLLATRGTAVLSIIFFMIDAAVRHRHSFRDMCRVFASLLIPVLISVLFLAWYNVVRFGSPLESGYGLAYSGIDLGAMRDAGLFGIRHLPGNLYYFLFSGPLPVTSPPGQALVFPYVTFSLWGVGIIYTAPYLLSLLWRRIGDRLAGFFLVRVSC